MKKRLLEKLQNLLAEELDEDVPEEEAPEVEVVEDAPMLRYELPPEVFATILKKYETINQIRAEYGQWLLEKELHRASVTQALGEATRELDALVDAARHDLGVPPGPGWILNFPASLDAPAEFVHHEKIEGDE